MQQPRFCRVAVDSPVQALDRPFDYAIPERMAGRVQVGSVVRVVLHGRNVRAFVSDVLEEAAVAKPRPLSSLVSPEPLFAADVIALARWTAHRYVVPLGVVLHDAIPGRFSTVDRPRTQAAATPSVSKPSWLKEDLPKRGESCVVLPSADREGELVAYAVGIARASARSALIICPRVEIAERLARVVPNSVLLHGDDRPSERASAWAAARDGEADVVIGGRSALFVPMPKLGLVVVASAHDRSLKSERSPRLHALVVARERARMSGAAFLGSSPAPPVELAADPAVGIAASKRGGVRPETTRPRADPVTPRLLEVIRWTIDRGRDALVFVGRRGDVLRLRCVDCGWMPACTECGSGLTLDAAGLVCRMCGVHSRPPDTCASCGGALAQRGWGHERVARALEKADVGAPVVRIVGDSGLPDGAIDRPKPAVVVGTLAAAHAIGSAGSVCVADLDQLLARPDFRAAEFALQTLQELAGVLAAGGRFLVQTRQAEHHVVQAFTRGSYSYFLERELPVREQMGYPPFGVVVRAEIQPQQLDDLRRALEPAGANVVGGIVRRGRMTVLVRASGLEPLLGPLHAFVAANRNVKIDVDPVEV